ARPASSSPADKSLSPRPRCMRWRRAASAGSWRRPAAPWPSPRRNSFMRETLHFLLFDWLRAGDLTARERFADHSRETFSAVLDTCERIAREKFAPSYRLMDTEEPRFDGERVHLPAATL